MIKSTPDIYQGLLSSPGMRNHTIVIDHNNNISIFDNSSQLENLKSFNTLIKDTIAYQWDGIDAFSKVGKQTILARHEEIFGCNPPKDQGIELTTLRTWEGMHKMAKTTFLSATPVNADGRKSNIATRKYFYGKNEDEKHSVTGELKTPQALASLRLFRRAILEKGGKDQKIDAETEKPVDIAFIDEGTLRKFIEDNAGELKTRQDPWRIFQYYRPEILKQGLIKHD